MKRIALAIATVFTVAAPAAFAQYDRYDRYEARDARNSNEWRDRGRRDDTARVVDSRPVHARESREECFNPRTGSFEELRQQEHTNIGKGAAIGAVAGGVLGHQVDSGGGTAAGAILGGVLGHQIERRNDRDEQTDLDRSRCRVVGERSGDVVGYDVRYEYNGREYVGRFDHDPGSVLRVGRDTQPDGTPLNAPSRYSRR
jgi:uncharacterized protein YcfJ